MPMNDSDRKLLTGLLIGAGVGAATVLLLHPKLRARLIDLIVNGTDNVAAGMANVGYAPESWKNRGTARADRSLRKKIEKIRTAGY